MYSRYRYIYQFDDDDDEVGGPTALKIESSRWSLPQVADGFFPAGAIGYTHSRIQKDELPHKYSKDATQKHVYELSSI